MHPTGTYNCYDCEFDNYTCTAGGSGSEPGGTGQHTGGGTTGGSRVQIKSEDIWEGINVCELQYLTIHPWIAPLLTFNRKAAENYSMINHPNANRDGSSPDNAFKHAFYQMLNTCSIGEESTRAMAEFHEECNGNLVGSAEDVAMDRHNNGVGISLGLALKSQGLCNNPIALYDMTEIAFHNGFLHKIDGTPTP